MRLNKWSMPLLACSIAAASSAFAEQRVDMLNLTRNGVAVPGTPPAVLFVKPGDMIKFDATLTQNGPPPGDPNYATAKTTGIGLCLEYTLAQVGDPVIANVFTPEALAPPTAQNGAPPGCTAGGSTDIPGADRFVLDAYATFVGSKFPGGDAAPGTTIPVKLYDATFTVQPGFNAPTMIGFAVNSTGSGNAFVSNAPAAIIPLQLCPAPTVTITKVADGAEPATNGSFNVTLSAPIPVACGIGGVFPVTVALTGTATYGAGNDYTTTPAAVGNNVVVNFPADGANVMQTITVNVLDDPAVEPVETVIGTVAPGNGNYIAGSTATVNITSDDIGPPTIGVGTIVNGGEPATNGSIQLTRAGNMVPGVNVNVTIAGTATRGVGGANDYYLTTLACAPANAIGGNTFTIPPGQAALTINVCVQDDVAPEPTETVILTIANPTNPGDYAIGAPANGTVNITDDDGPITVTIVATTPNAAEPATNGLFTISRTGGNAAQLAQPLVVNLTIAGTATNGTDYANIPTTATILANQTSVTVPVTVINDNLVEGTESVVLTVVANGNNYTIGNPAAATVNIADDENAVGTAATTAASIEGQNVVFTISCTNNAGNVTVNYAFSGTYTPLPANVNGAVVNCATGLVVTVPTIDDFLQNGTRTLTMTITQVGPAPAAIDPARISATANVLDNEAPRNIPTMSTLGMMLMGLLLAGAAAGAIRRKG